MKTDTAAQIDVASDPIASPTSRPLILAPWQVRPAISGHLTRLVVPLDAEPVSPNARSPIREIVPSLSMNQGDLWDVRYDGDNPKAVRCPLGRPGDRLWVKEAWAPAGEGGAVWFKVGVPVYVYFAGQKTTEWADYDRLMGMPIPVGLRWKSSATMPRWASRLTLEIRSVRPMRLQDLTEAGAIECGSRVPSDTLPKPCRQAAWSERQVIAKLWDNRYGKPRPGKPDRSWAAGPWVWNVEVGRVDE